MLSAINLGKAIGEAHRKGTAVNFAEVFKTYETEMRARANVCICELYLFTLFALFALFCFIYLLIYLFTYYQDNINSAAKVTAWMHRPISEWEAGDSKTPLRQQKVEAGK